MAYTEKKSGQKVILNEKSRDLLGGNQRSKRSKEKKDPERDSK